MKKQTIILARLLEAALYSSSSEVHVVGGVDGLRIMLFYFQQLKAAVPCLPEKLEFAALIELEGFSLPTRSTNSRLCLDKSLATLREPPTETFLVLW